MGPLVHGYIAELYFGKKIFNKHRNQIMLGSIRQDTLGYVLYPGNIKKGFKTSHTQLNTKKFPKFFAESWNLHLKADNYMHENYIYKIQPYLKNKIGDAFSHEMCELTFDLLLNTEKNIFYKFPDVRREKKIMQTLETKFGAAVVLEKLAEIFTHWNKDYPDFIMRTLAELGIKNKKILTRSQLQNYVNMYAGLLKSPKRCAKLTGQKLDYLGMIKSFPPIRKVA